MVAMVAMEKRMGMQYQLAASSRGLSPCWSRWRVGCRRGQEEGQWMGQAVLAGGRRQGRQARGKGAQSTQSVEVGVHGAGGGWEE